MSEQTIRVLVYSDDKDIRQAVIEGLGNQSVDGTPIEWVETATAWGALDQYEAVKPDLLIFDAEAHKVGGMAVARQIEAQFDNVPPLMLLAARPQDQWLASWVGAATVALSPLNPETLHAAFTKALGYKTLNVSER